MMKAKRIGAFLIAAAMLSATMLTGCGSGGGGTSSGGSGTPAGDNTPAEGGEVVLWNQKFEEWNEEFFTMRGEEYNALNRGYTLTQEFIPGDAWTERITTAQASGTAPDLFVLAYNQVVANAQKKLTQPLEGFVSQEALDDILPNVKQMVTYDGKYYAYPQLVEPSTVLYYRTDLFEAAGLTEPPKTWDELVEYAKKLQTADVFGLGVSGFNEMGWTTWGWQYSSAGHLAINDNWDAPTLDEGYKDLALFYKRLYDEGVVPEQPLSGYGGIEGFGSGGLAMCFSGSWGVAGLINDYPDLADKFDIAPPPTKDGNLDKTTATNGGWAYAIDGQAQNPKGAGDYINWLLGGEPEICGEFFKIAQFSKSAPRTSVQEWVNAQAGDSPWADAINHVAGYAMPEPVYPWDISVAVALMIENTATNAMSVDEAMAMAETQIKDIIANQSLAGTNPIKK